MKAAHDDADPLLKTSANMGDARASTPPRQNAKQTIAYHEAGHAVIARVLKMVCGSATIVPNYTEGEWGHAIVKPPLAAWDAAASEDDGKYRELGAFVRGWIIMKMAGAEAERILLGTEAIRDDNDRQNIAWMIDSELPDANEPRLRRATAMLVRRHRAAISAVAKGLLRRRTLSGRQIDAIVHRVERTSLKVNTMNPNAARQWLANALGVKVEDLDSLPVEPPPPDSKTAPGRVSKPRRPELALGRLRPL